VSVDLLAAVVTAMTLAATPLLLAAIGEVVTEKAGVLNLGVEGMMLIGAVVAFAATSLSGSASVGILSAALAGAAMSLLFAVLALTLLANQVATGLALTILGIGLSALIGKPFVGTPLPRLPQLSIPGLSDLPFVGPVLFGHDALVYFSVAAVFGLWWFLEKTRWGLILRAVGESHDSAHAIGYPVIAIRYGATVFGGALAGIAGAYLSLAYTPMWAENMTAGRGWIALALVVFATWRPFRTLAGAYIFGGVTIAQLHLQGHGFDVPSQFLSMLPYLATVLVLALISRDATRIRLNTPACLGQPFKPAQ
jgi:simple sugar transport system permease protein